MTSTQRLAHYDPEPFRYSGWCGRCAVCAAARRTPTDACGCPAGHRSRRSACPAEPFEMSVTEPGSSWPAAASCLHALGRRLAHAGYYRAPMSALPGLRNRAVLAQAVAMSSPRHVGRSPLEQAGLTFPQALVLVVSQLRYLVASGDLSEQTADKIATHLSSLCLFMTDGLKKPVVAEADPADMHRWIASRTQRGNQPSVAVRHNRRNAARVFYRVLRRLGLCAADPTLDIRLPARVPVAVRPLEEDELLQTRFASQARHGDTRLPAAAALGEAGLGTGELPHALIKDADLPGERVWVHATRRADARWAYLSPWAMKQIQARIEYLQGQGLGPDTPLVYEGGRGGGSAQSSACLALNEILELAGLAGEPGIKPNSFAAAYARRVWEQTADLGAAADSVGRRSLDSTATLIGYQWHTEPDQREEQLRSAARRPLAVAAPPAGQFRSDYRRSVRGRRPAAASIAPAPASRTVPGMNVRRSQDAAR